MSRQGRVTVTRPCEVCGIQTRSRLRRCPEHRTAGRGRTLNRDVISEIRRLAAAGKDDHQIAIALGLARNTICAARNRHDIPPGRLDLLRCPTTSQPAHEPAVLTPDEQAKARCRYVDPELFFEAPQERGNGPVGRARVKQAKGVCVDCPVRLACLRVALANGERFGVWGGLTVEERNQLKRAVAS